MTTKEELLKKYQDLPADLRTIIFSESLEGKVVGIGSHHGLHIDQIGDLVDLVNMVILGSIKAGTFGERVRSTLEIATDKATAITEDIDQEIFLPIRSSLQKLAEGRKEELVHPDLESPHPSKEEILEAISNPEQVAPIKPRVGAEITRPPEGEKTLLLPIKAEVDLPKIHQEKLQNVVRIAKQETQVAPAINRQSIIPEDLKQKINQDPYKEPI